MSGRTEGKPNRGQNKTMAFSSTALSHWMIGTAGAMLLISALPAAAQTREEILRETDRPLSQAPTTTIETDDGIERAPCPLANPEFSGVRFTLQAVDFSNLGPIDPALLESAWRGRVGSEIPVSDICDIRDRAATILRREGYLAAVRVPVQTIENGRVQLDILAARLVGIQVRGGAGANEAQLERYLAKLEGQPLFNAYDAERYLLLAGGIPGISARLTLRPGGAPGEVVGEVTVDRTPAYFDTNIQNFGSNSVGRWGGIARVRLNGLTGMGDETTLGFYATPDLDEQKVVQGSHEFRIGGEGLTVGTSATYAWTEPTLPGNLDIQSETLVWSSYARYPLMLRQARSLWAGGGFDWIDQDIDLGGVPLNRDRLRIAFARLDANWIDPATFTGGSEYSPAEPRWSAGFALEVRQGIAGLGASPQCSSNPPACFGPGRTPTSRAEGDPGATVLRVTGEMVWRPVPAFTIAVLPRAQYSSSPLLAYEEYSAGNYAIGRGYDPGTVSGDSGVGTAVELRLGSLVPANDRDIAIQPFVFFDAGWIWNEDSAFAGLGAEEVYSVGGGARIALGDKFRIDLTAAQPLRRTSLETDRQDIRFLISLTAQFGLGR